LTETGTTSSRPSSTSPTPPARQVRVTRVYEETRKSFKEIVINLGGARSSKSYSTAQRLVEKFFGIPRRKILVTRKYGPALTRTAARLIIEQLQASGYYHRLEHNKSDGIIVNPSNGARFEFFSIDQSVKIKSTEYNDVWMEEADEFTWDDFLMLQTRMSAPETDEHPNQIFLSLNPSDELGWANQKIILNPEFKGLFSLIRSTYRDNLPNLSPKYIAKLQALETQDPVYFQVYAQGEWGTLSNVIYKPYEIVDRFPESCDEVLFGLDFGFNNPSALVRIGIKDGKEVYLEQLLYQTGLNNGQLIEKLQGLIPEGERSAPIYCDAAEPARIDEICASGFYALPADKSVKDGLDFCARFSFRSLSSNVDLNKERGSYKWKQDRNGNVLDEPVKFMDHLMDAKRYALYTHHKDRMNIPGLFVG
jgi:phage terminase large subunit